MKVQKKYQERFILKEPHCTGKKGENIGKITYFLNDTKIDDIPIYASESVNRATYLDYILKSFKKLVFSTYAA